MPFLHNSTYLLALLFGLRHGIDWDHISAITDISGTVDDKRRGLLFAFMYAIGHAFVIVLLGSLAVMIGIRLPSWVDGVMQRFVGITLIVLSVWLMISLLKYRKNFKMKSRLILLIDSIIVLQHYLHSKIPHSHPAPLQVTEIDEHIYGLRTAFAVGVIHGVGAETPTQLILFTTAAGVSTPIQGMVLVMLFVVGLLVSNSVIAGLTVFGYTAAKKNSLLYIGIGLATGIVSFIVGVLYLFDRTSLLPPFFA